jgi:ABC-2 type transport system permease protein
MATMAQNAVQVAVLVATAALFGVHFRTGVLGLLICLLMASVVSVIVSGFSLALAARIRSPEVLVSIFTCIALPLVCGSTVILPTLFMPQWLVNVSAWNPLTFAVKPLRDLVNKGWFLDDLAVNATRVVLAAGAVFAVVVRQFRRSVA